MEPDKQFYWQKTEKCAACQFGDDPGACHYYGYRFSPELPLAHDCWQFLTPAQWKELQGIRVESQRLERWEQIRHHNHPGLPTGWQPPYRPKLKADPKSLPEDIRKWWLSFEAEGD